MDQHKAKRVLCAVCLGLLLLGMAERAAAATITNHLQYLNYNSPGCPWRQYDLALNVGDIVVWVNEGTELGTPNYVESYGGEWKSPALNLGDSFSFTFTTPGFYAYRTGLGGPGENLVGAITVNAWTGAPAPVTINTPVEGSVLSANPRAHVLLQASVTNADVIAEIQYFANTNWIGTGVRPAYAIEWTNPAPGQCVLVAKAVDQQGAATLSRPVNVLVNSFTGPDFSLWGPRILPGGKFFVFYHAYPYLRNAITSMDSVTFSNAVDRVRVTGSGAWVDESPAGQRRFYFIFWAG